MTVIVSPISGRIVGRHGPRAPLLIAGAAMALGSAMLTGIGPATPLPELLAAYVVFGLGFGFVNAPITNAAVSGMPRAQAGVAAAIATTSRQIGLTLGVAVVGAIADPAWWLLTACGVAILMLGLAATSSRAAATALQHEA